MLVVFHLKQFKESFKNEYELIRWIVYVFLGGSMNFMSIHLLGNYIITLFGQVQNQQQQLMYQSYVELSILLIIFYFIPVLISVALTILSPEKRIVPPFFMQIISLGALLFYVQYYIPDIQSRVLALYVMFIYAFLGGITQDRIVVRLVGQSVDRESMKQISLKVNTKLKNLESILMTSYFRNRLHLGTKIEEISDGLRLKNNERSDFKIIMDLVEGSIDGETIVNIIIFDKGRYYFKKSDDLTQFARSELNDLLDVLSQQKEPIQTNQLPETNADYLINKIIEDVSGISAHIKQTSALGWFKVSMFIAALFSVGVVYFVLKDTTNAVVVGVLIVLYLAFEMPSRFGKLR